MFLMDSFSMVSIAGFLLIAAITLASAPPKDIAGKNRSAIFWLIAGTVLAYSAGSIWIFLLGWALTTVPFRTGKSSGVLFASTAALAVAAVVGTFGEGRNAQWMAFGGMVLAALLRKGIFPFHFWVPLLFEEAPLPAANLLLNSHMGAFLMIRFGFQQYPELSAQSLAFLSVLAIFTAVYAAFLALVATRPRRILALLCISQASFILAGLENRNVEGITGALVHWSVVALATTSLLTVYRSLEVRTMEVESPAGFLGLGFHAPRLAVFFAVAALTLVGLPGTLGFAAEDLLFHGSLESHPLLGIGLPLATALNAITALRLVATLFWGKRGIHVPAIPDAMPAERWALTLPLVLLVAGGISPALFIGLRSPSAHWIAEMLGGR